MQDRSRSSNDRLHFLVRKSSVTFKENPNTFESLERYQLQAAASIELVPVGPALPSAYTDSIDEGDTAFGSDLLEQDAKDRYTKWLDAQPDHSVPVHAAGAAAGGDLSGPRAIEESGRPYLWVAWGHREGVAEGSGGRGMVVEWCSQLEGEPRPQPQLQSPHFLVVSFPAQGHVNPTLQLAKRLARLGARVTFSTTVPTHRRISPPAPPSDTPPSPPLLLRYAPYSIGEYDDGRAFATIDQKHYLHLLKTVGSLTLAEVARDLAAEGLPVTCIVYNFLVPWAADVARELGVPSVLYWIQPATVFAIYYHYFHGYADLIVSHREEPFLSVDLPGLPPFRIRDLPSIFLSKSPEDVLFFPLIEELFRSLDRQICEGKASKLKILVNTFEALERDLDQLRPADRLEFVPIGPTLPSAYTDGIDAKDTAFGSDLFDQESKEHYAGWLDAQPDRSVVYISFGSYAVLSPQQREEITRALEEIRRPYLWVARGLREGVADGGDGRGMVVDWCSQLEVLSHPAVGCFVTHCGWNSTLESLACGVPTVGLPQWTDQATNSRLAEAAWGTGVRAEAGAEGLLEAAELRRCLDLVMGDSEEGVQLRRNAASWKEKAREAVRQGGSSDRNLRAFVNGDPTVNEST
ncbi:hypothetical protein Taro_023380 [Colocasia esculenta]|uniref:Glycosyltransferase n=1 Tax=Colocasia esculenta TaxID=4460 RepID=A0A843V843_COLES|nr:hypothetical protein [Colocasia esculenta]